MSRGARAEAGRKFVVEAAYEDEAELRDPMRLPKRRGKCYMQARGGI